MLESIYLGMRCHVKLRFLKQFRWKSNEWKWVQFIHQHWNMPKFPEHSWLNENVNETTGENDKQKEKQKKCASLQWHRQWWRSNRCSVAMRLGCAMCIPSTPLWCCKADRNCQMANTQRMFQCRFGSADYVTLRQESRKLNIVWWLHQWELSLHASNRELVYLQHKSSFTLLLSALINSIYK